MFIVWAPRRWITIYRGSEAGGARKGAMLAVHFSILFIVYTLFGRWVMDTFGVDGDILVMIFLVGVGIYLAFLARREYRGLKESLKYLLIPLTIMFVAYQLLLLALGP